MTSADVPSHRVQRIARMLCRTLALGILVGAPALWARVGGADYVRLGEESSRLDYQRARCEGVLRLAASQPWAAADATAARHACAALDGAPRGEVRDSYGLPVYAAPDAWRARADAADQATTALETQVLDGHTALRSVLLLLPFAALLGLLGVGVPAALLALSAVALVGSVVERGLPPLALATCAAAALVLLPCEAWPGTPSDVRRPRWGGAVLRAAIGGSLWSVPLMLLELSELHYGTEGARRLRFATSTVMVFLVSVAVPVAFYAVRGRMAGKPSVAWWLGVVLTALGVLVGAALVVMANVYG